MADIGTDIYKAKEILSAGGLVAIPTETVYGLAANAFDEDAVLKIFKAKNRPAFDPLITHIGDRKQLDSLVQTIPALANQLIEAFWPGPLTLVLKKSDKISDLVSSGLPTAAFRIPKHPLTRSLLQTLDFPVVAPSANPFGYISPTNANHVNLQLGDKIDYILDGGTCKIGLESTIIAFDQKKPVILRLGGLSVEQIEASIGPVKTVSYSSSNPEAPGMLISHYSPQKRIIAGDIDQLLKTHQNLKIGVLSFNKIYDDYLNFVLSAEGSLEEAAKRLFAGLRWLDEQNIDLIITEFVPAIGLGRAINDRINRATAH